jgi:hypothetical protein
MKLPRPEPRTELIGLNLTDADLAQLDQLFAAVKFFSALSQLMGAYQGEKLLAGWLCDRATSLSSSRSATKSFLLLINANFASKTLRSFCVTYGVITASC